jgi:beta-glucosidase
LALNSLLVSGVSLFCRTGSNPPTYLDANLPISRRVDDLLSRMTLKEKIGQLNLPCVYVDQLGKTIPEKCSLAKSSPRAAIPTK